MVVDCVAHRCNPYDTAQRFGPALSRTVYDASGWACLYGCFSGRVLLDSCAPFFLRRGSMVQRTLDITEHTNVVHTNMLGLGSALRDYRISPEYFFPLKPQYICHSKVYDLPYRLR